MAGRATWCGPALPRSRPIRPGGSYLGPGESIVQPSQGSVAARDSRNHALDGLRGLAAMSVALGHCAVFAGGLALWNTSLRGFTSLSWSAIVLRLLSAVFPS